MNKDQFTNIKVGSTRVMYGDKECEIFGKIEDEGILYLTWISYGTEYTVRFENCELLIDPIEPKDKLAKYIDETYEKDNELDLKVIREIVRKEVVDGLVFPSLEEYNDNNFVIKAHALWWFKTQTKKLNQS